MEPHHRNDPLVIRVTVRKAQADYQLNQQAHQRRRYAVIPHLVTMNLHNRNERTPQVKVKIYLIEMTFRNQSLKTLISQLCRLDHREGQ